MRFFGMRSHNPVLSRMAKEDTAYGIVDVASYRGVAGKIFLFLALVLVGALTGIFLALESVESVGVLLPVAAIVAFIAAIVAFLAPKTTKISGSIYALAQGYVVGLISFAFEAMVSGVVLVTLISTFTVLLVVATLYMTNLVRVNSTFVRFLYTFAISVLLTMFIVFILSLFIPNVAIAMSTPWIMIGVSFIMVFLATLYLFFDMEVIRQVVEGGFPKQMEWYASFGLVFTIVWLYMELLPLIARFIRSQN